MDRVKKKIREATFFLGKLVERSRLAFGDREEFDFYLSAFLSASRSVDYRLRHEQNPAYETFRNTWDAALTPSDHALMRFMVDDRNLEIHESGSSRIQGNKQVVIGNAYEDASGIVTIASAPDIPLAEIIKPTFSFVMNGTSFPVLDACASYLRLLERLVFDYTRHVGAP